MRTSRGGPRCSCGIHWGRHTAPGREVFAITTPGAHEKATIGSSNRLMALWYVLGGGGARTRTKTA